MKKNFLKKTAAILLSAAMCTSMVACGSGTGSTAATADDGQKTYTVGVVQYVDDASLNQIEENIESRLAELGVEKNVKFSIKYENGQADGTTLNQIAADLVADKVDLIVAIATPTAQIMQAATEDDQIPIVFAASSDPVGAKLVASMDEPGGNITGTSDALNTEAIFNLMFAQNPDTKKVGLLYSKSEDASTQAIADAKAILDEKGVEYVEKTGTTVDEVSSAADALIAEGVDAVFTPTDNTIMKSELAIYEKFNEAKIPHYAGADSFALNGTFVGYGVDYANLGRETANMVSEILVDGKDISTMPVKTFDNGLAMINTETCEELGYDLSEVEAAFKPYCTEIKETTTKQEFDAATSSDSDSQ